MIERIYLRAFDRLSRRPAAPLAALGVLAAVSLAGLPELRLDLSFRPLFADSPVETETTREFEAEFGQASGAHVGVIVEAPDVLAAGFLHDLAEASAAIAAIDGVTEVVSLARLAVPVWSGGVARGEPAIPPELQASPASAELEDQLALIAASPGIRRALVSEDGRRTLLLARLGPPLSDLEGRGEVIREIEAVTRSHMDGSTVLRFVGVSVVEAAYARIVLESLARSFGLTTLALLTVLWVVFRRAAAVAVVMTGVSLAIPVTVGLLALLGQDLTMVNSMVPVMILVIGVADGIHMLQAYGIRIRRGEPRGPAIRGMFGEMALPCLLTTVTTAVGFMALHVAEITAIRDFGLNVALGVIVAYLFNLVTIPAMLAIFPADRMVAPGRGGRISAWWCRTTFGLVTARASWIVAAGVALTIISAAALPGLDIDQRFNEEVAASHPIRADQAILEREFGGFLGPDLRLERVDGGSLVDSASLTRLSAYVEEVRKIPGVLRVESVLDLLPAGTYGDEAASGLRQLRLDPLLGSRTRELLSEDGARTAVMIRIEDIGTRRAHQLVAELERLTALHLGPGYRAQVVGQWWLAQRGMDHITRDMLASFATSCLLILPLLALALRRARLVLIAALPNVLPMLFALAFMSWTGISLRIGTAMILAIALGIAIDDTIHFLVRLREESGRLNDPAAAVEATTRAVGGALIITTVVLVIGFLSMLSNDLLAIRDMGLVASATLTVALFADLYLAPALFLLASRRSPAPATGLAPALTAADTP